eukprot:g8496.t1
MESMQPGALLNEGRYKLIQQVNRGATAVVYEAMDTSNDSKVALKVMNSMESHQSSQLKMVKREVEYASNTSHPNIVRLLDVFAEDKQLILVWELIEGQDLLDLLNKVGGQMPEEMAAFYLHQILRGVAFMHEKAFCHRDLKPENCMVEKRTQILKIIDFGLSKHLDSVNTLGVGTPDYMSPEMLGIGADTGRKEGPKYDATAVDVWALGVTFYLLVTGVYPFENPDHPNSLSHTLQNIRKGAIQSFPTRVSNECEALIRALLAQTPKDRPSLKVIAEDKWLNKNARIYAQKIKKPELYISPIGQREESKTTPVSPNQVVEDNHESPGCFGGTQTTEKSKLFSFLRNIFR